MSTDRELLEKAARAAGIELAPRGWVDEYGAVIGYEREGPIRWNPLTDDGDALRLAVELGLEVDACGDDICCRYSPHKEKMVGRREVWINVEEGGDRYAATRRAIVRAAAALGEQHDQ